MGKWTQFLDAIMKGPAPPPPPYFDKMRFDKALVLQSYERGHVHVDWNVDRAFMNAAGFVFGGYIAAIADNVADLAMMTVHEDNEFHTTRDLRVSFFRPIFPGTVRIDVKVVSHSKSSGHVELEYFDAAGKLCAKAVVVENIRPLSEILRPA